VQVALDDVDITKIDGKTLSGAVVEITPVETFRVVICGGVLHRTYPRHAFTVLRGASNNRTLVKGLRLAYENWKTLPEITEREAACNVSLVGEQGMNKCACKKGKCQSKRCPCFKLDRLCNSRCHKGNICCENHD
jgi:hypothetical protein